MNFDDLLSAQLVQHGHPRPTLITPDGQDVEEALRSGKIVASNPLEQFYIDITAAIFENYGKAPDKMMGKVQSLVPPDETGQMEPENS